MIPRSRPLAASCSSSGESTRTGTSHSTSPVNGNVLRGFEWRRPKEEGEGRRSEKYESDGDRLGTRVGFAQ